MKDIPRDKFKNYLVKKGLKFTPERETILEDVFTFHNHFDIDQLYEKIHKRDKSLSRATIYRTIPHLVNCGLIREVLRCQNRAQYEHTFGHEHHDHLVCIKCGNVIEFNEKRIEKLQDEICKKYDFTPVEHRLGIRGYCKKCQRRNR